MANNYEQGTSVSIWVMCAIVAAVSLLIGGFAGYLIAPDAEEADYTGYVAQAEYNTLLDANKVLTNESAYWQGQYNALNSPDVAVVAREAYVTELAKDTYEASFIEELDFDGSAFEDSHFITAYLAIDLDEDEEDYDVSMHTMVLEYNEDNLLQNTYYADATMTIEDDNDVKHLSIAFSP